MIPSFYILHAYCEQLMKEYTLIYELLTKKSGFGWDDTHKAPTAPNNV